MKLDYPVQNTIFLPVIPTDQTTVPRAYSRRIVSIIYISTWAKTRSHDPVDPCIHICYMTRSAEPLIRITSTAIDLSKRPVTTIGSFNGVQSISATGANYVASEVVDYMASFFIVVLNLSIMAPDANPMWWICMCCVVRTGSHKLTVYNCRTSSVIDCIIALRYIVLDGSGKVDGRNDWRCEQRCGSKAYRCDHSAGPTRSIVPGVDSNDIVHVGVTHPRWSPGPSSTIHSSPLDMVLPSTCSCIAFTVNGGDLPDPRPSRWHCFLERG